MKKLFFVALTLCLLIAAVLYMNSSRDFAPAPQTKNSNSNSNSVSNSVSNSNLNSNSLPPVRSVETAAPSSTALSGVPTTEDGALGYLQSSSSQAWTVKRDYFSPTIRTLSEGSLANSANATPREAADAFVKFYAKGLFGVEAERVKFNREEITDRTRLIYDQVVDGVPVYGGSLSLFFENGALTRVQNDLAVGEIEESSKSIPVETAFEAYKSQTQRDSTLLSNQANRTVLYPTGHSLIYISEFLTMEESKSFHVLYDPYSQFVIQRRPSAIQ